MSDLKPCPFCGGKALVLRVTETRWKAACLGMKCSAAMTNDTSADECATAWNRRAPAPDAVKEPKCPTCKDTGVYPTADGIGHYCDCGQAFGDTVKAEGQ